jgi:hypothetical protein
MRIEGGRAFGERRCGGGVSAADPYETLGVAPGADQDTVKAAYLRLMREHHPDRTGPHDPEAARRAMEINAAYDFLRQGSKRPPPSGFDARPGPPAPRPGVARRFRGPSIAARAERLRKVRRFRTVLLAAALVLAAGGLSGLAAGISIEDLVAAARSAFAG